jgi:hypothetical protein
LDEKVHAGCVYEFLAKPSFAKLKVFGPCFSSAFQLTALTTRGVEMLR